MLIHQYHTSIADIRLNVVHHICEYQLVWQVRQRSAVQADLIGQYSVVYARLTRHNSRQAYIRVIVAQVVSRLSLYLGAAVGHWLNMDGIGEVGVLLGEVQGVGEV